MVGFRNKAVFSAPVRRVVREQFSRWEASRTDRRGAQGVGSDRPVDWFTVVGGALLQRERDREESNKLNSSTGALALDGGWRRRPKQVKGPSDWFIVVDLLRYGPTDWLLPCNTIGIPSREALPIRLVLLLPPARTKWRWSKNVTNDCKQTHIPPLNKWVRKMDFDYP